MILWSIMMVFITIISMCIGSLLEFHWVINATIAVAAYSGMVFIMTFLMLAVSLLLGKTDKLVLREKSSYSVTNIDELYVYYISRGKEFRYPRMHIDKIICQHEIEIPQLVVNRYNCGGWRKWLLFNLYEDTIENILYVPECYEEES